MTPPALPVGAAVAQEVREVRTMLGDAGLSAGILVRDLASGHEAGIDPDLEMPAASLVKVPVALATLERIRRGELDPASPVVVDPGRLAGSGPPGITRFRHPASVALEDLLYLAVSLSDSSACDALLALTPPAQVGRLLRELGVPEVEVRHGLGELGNTPAEALEHLHPGLGHVFAATATTAHGGSAIRSLDVSVTTTVSARVLADLLGAVWGSGRIGPEVSARLRELLAANVHRQRLAPEFERDSSTWSSKTGTVLNLRHEAGVVEHADGGRVVVVVLSRSSVPAGVQPAAEIALGRAARRLHDVVRRTAPSPRALFRAG
ncbi:serine hydrolase [Krasilnikoviella flava]|uniref:Beta-lactamase class A n=1 Tax=Krasilnikoviella flava TaxID=526729 RepID=A0A1T5LJV7_9MICO|nr:serine hydrolase [Krasilnikoviella flava]SKC76250.1 beta-lactamase class A [Krasilnikoviella flava]